MDSRPLDAARLVSPYLRQLDGAHLLDADQFTAKNPILHRRDDRTNPARILITGA